MAQEALGISSPRVADHEVICRIATGSYGSVWLARSVLGSYRALKVVQAETFKSARHYEREFAGVRHFEPISRSHAGFVHILHVGRNDQAGYFYYVMELADDVETGQKINPARYRPRTLRSELDARRRLPIEDCVRLVDPLLLALDELHRRGLVHRDVKPANFIFVNGVPKFADIGLVAAVSKVGTLVGSVGYNPPEGSGQPSGDIFSFGRVLYEMFGGVNVQALADDLPDLLPRLQEGPPKDFYAVISRAMSVDPRQRPQSAAELRTQLERFVDARRLVEKGDVKELESGALQAVAIVGTVRKRKEGASGASKDVYIPRDADRQLEAALESGEAMILITGARQMGKTSLLVRGLRDAKKAGRKVAFTDLQKLNSANLENLDALYQALGESLADQLGIEKLPREFWDPRRAANANLDRYVRRQVLAEDQGEVLWALDEVDRLFSCPFHSEFFGLLRAWYNERSVEVDGPLSRLSLMVTYSTDVRLFITDLNQSPFNVGTRIELEDFNLDELAELNELHGSPLRGAEAVRRYFELLHGEPHLSRFGLRELARGTVALEDLEAESSMEQGVFAAPLQRLLQMIRKDEKLLTAVKRLLGGAVKFDLTTFDRMQSAGIVTRGASTAVKFRCVLYERFLRQHV